MILIQMILISPIQKSGLCSSSIRYLHLYVVLIIRIGKPAPQTAEHVSSSDSEKNPLTAVKIDPNQFILARK